jgi:hypothetical protein
MIYRYIFLLILISSCASKEYYQTKKACETAAFQSIPPKYEQGTYTYYETKEVPTGEFNCSTSSDANYSYYGGSTIYGRETASTNCKPVTKQVREEKLGITSYDIYKDYREQEIEKCIVEICNERYRNKDCDN